jgi:hypothetical protein
MFSRREELDDLIWIIQKESEMKSDMRDPHSSASGLGGLLVSTYRELKLKPTKDEKKQLKAVMLYIKNRYGNPRNARIYWERHKFY